MKKSVKSPLTEQETLALVSRMELTSDILQRHIEEEIISLVNLSEDWHQNALEEFLQKKKLSAEDLPTWLHKKNWQSEDLRINLARSEALSRFSKQRFGPGLEERYLSSASDFDSVIYSLVRVKDPLLARELWLRLCEKEISFVDVASLYGEGPEAQRKGLIGPIAMGSLEPKQLRNALRALSPGELTPPQQIGEWTLLLRLEQLSPSAFDENMRQHLLEEQLKDFLQDRTKALLEETPVEPLNYYPE